MQCAPPAAPAPAPAMMTPRLVAGSLEMVPAMLLANLATLLLASLITVLASTTGIMSLNTEELCISLTPP